MSKSKINFTPDDTPKNQKTSKTKNAPGSPRIDDQGGDGVKIPPEAESGQDAGEILEETATPAAAVVVQSRAGKIPCRESRFSGITAPGSQEHKENTIPPMPNGWGEKGEKRLRLWNLVQKCSARVEFRDIGQVIKTWLAGAAAPDDREIDDIEKRVKRLDCKIRLHTWQQQFRTAQYPALDQKIKSLLESDAVPDDREIDDIEKTVRVFDRLRYLQSHFQTETYHPEEDQIIKTWLAGTVAPDPMEIADLSVKLQESHWRRQPEIVEKERLRRIAAMNDQSGDNAGSDATSATPADNGQGEKREPLTEKAKLVYEKLKGLQKHEAMTGPAILNWFSAEHDLEIDSATLRSSYLKPLKAYGLKNKPKVGYYLNG